MANSELIGVKVRRSKSTARTKKVRAVLTIEVTIDYPGDMPPEIAEQYATTAGEWTRKYGLALAHREEREERTARGD